MIPSVPTAGAAVVGEAWPASTDVPVKGWPLRRYLLVMVLALLLPLLAFAGVLTWYDLARQHDIYRRGMQDTARVLSLAVDREWTKLQSIVQTLTDSPLLEAADLSAFYALCARVAARQPGAWIVLFASSGQQVFNTLRPFGATLHNIFTEHDERSLEQLGELPLASADAVRRVLQTGQPVYSDLFMARVAQRPAVTINVPVRQAGHVAYVLTMAVSPENFTRLLQERGVSMDSISAIIDRRGMIIARSWESQQFIGRRIPLALHADIGTSDTGWGRGHSLERVPVYYAWARSAVTGWATLINVPVDNITRPIRRSLVLWGGCALLALGLGLALALGVARRITTPITVLTQSADLVQRGQPFALPAAAIQEVGQLSAALLATVEAMRQQTTERERRLIAEAESAERHRAAEVLAEANAALRQAEAAERLLRERWQTTLTSIGDAVMVTDTAGCISFLNVVAQTLTGWPAHEALGRPLHEVFKIIDEHTRQVLESPVTRVLREGSIVGLANHTLLLPRDGGEVSIDDSAAPIREAEGALLGVVLVFRNVTERRQAEVERAQREMAQRFLAEAGTLLASALDTPTQIEHLARLLVPTLGDWCSIDLLQDDGRIHRLAVVHADPAKAPLAEKLRQQYPLLPAAAPHTLARVWRTAQSWFDPAVDQTRLYGEARDAAHWELIQALGFTAEIVVPLLARGRVLGTITCVLGDDTRHYTTADLTLAEDLARSAALALDNTRLYQEARAAQAALQQAHRSLEQRVQERTLALERAMAERQRLEQEARRAEHFALLGRLASGVSHEIRNPLGAVFLHVDLLAEELGQPSQDSPAVMAEALAEIKTNLARLDDLVQDYLSLVRVHATQREVQNLGAAVEAWGAEFQTLAAARGMRVQCENLAGLGLVAFHASTLRRALLNLVHNAFDAMQPGGTVVLAGQSTAARVQIEVRDTGSGIAAERLEQIFEPLHTTKPGGTGLGLHIVQEVLAAHGGQVTVQSVVGQGTTFTLTLPRTAVDSSLQDADMFREDESR